MEIRAQLNEKISFVENEMAEVVRKMQEHHQLVGSLEKRKGVLSDMISSFHDEIRYLDDDLAEIADEMVYFDLGEDAWLKAEELLSKGNKINGRIELLQLGQKAIEKALKPLTEKHPVSGIFPTASLQDRQVDLHKRLLFWKEMNNFQEAENDSLDSLTNQAINCSFSEEEKIEAREILQTLCKEKGAFYNWSEAPF